MRFLLYNVRYGSGVGKGFHLPFPGRGYLRRTASNLAKITAFIKSVKPDIVGLVEIDSGSFRTGGRHQAADIAEALGHYHAYRSKYGPDSWNHLLPLLSKQGNAILANRAILKESYHYFDHGIKRLVIQAELKDVTVFLVHLSLAFRHRQHQLHHLYNLVRQVEKPCIVAGDFNVFWGNREIELFLAATGLQNASPRGQPTYPSWAPKRQLDFVLHSPDLQLTQFSIPQVHLSDHFPLVCDFELTGHVRRGRRPA